MVPTARKVEKWPWSAWDSPVALPGQEAPSANYLGIASRWTRALLDAYLGKDTVKGALTVAARDIDGIARGTAHPSRG